LTWESNNARSVSIEPAIGEVDLSGRIRFFPDATMTYTVSAVGPGGTATESVTVTVVADPAGAGAVSEEDIRTDLTESNFESMVKPVFFDFDSASLSDEAMLTLDGNIRWLSQPQNLKIRFVLEGHCDDRGSEEYNLALGDKRATVVLEYLKNHGIDPARMTAISLGEEKPFDSRETDGAYALNRRTQFVLLEPR